MHAFLLPNEIQMEFGPQLAALESAGYRIVDSSYAPRPHGDWTVQLEGPRSLWLTKDSGLYGMEGPRQELEAAGLWQPLGNLDEYWRRLAAYTGISAPLPDLDQLTANKHYTHPGNPHGKFLVTLIVMASITTTLVLVTLSWALGREGHWIRDLIRYSLWALMWFGLYRGWRGSRIAGILFFAVSGLYPLYLLAVSPWTFMSVVMAIYGLVHLLGALMLLCSRPVREHFGLQSVA
jgi:hypothetical protein